MITEITSNSCSDSNKASLYYWKMKEDFKTRLNRLLENKRSTQTALANYIGRKPQTVQQWANGNTKPNGANLEKAAKFLGVTPAYLMFGDESESSIETTNNTITKLRPSKKALQKRADLTLEIIGSLKDASIDDLEKIALIAKNSQNPKESKESVNDNGNNGSNGSEKQ